MRNEREEKSVQEVCIALNSLGITTKKTESQFETYDILTTGKTEGVVEVKNRDLSKDKFIKYWTKEGFLLESAKYYKLRNKNSMYINIFDLDGIEVIIGWNLSGEKDCTKNKSTESTIVNCPVTSEFTDHIVYVEKDCWLIKRRTTTLRMIKVDGKWVSLSMNNFNKYFGL